ncbi:MAG TPA: hypothetical protein VHT27_07990 [Solirubrobacteraceae bacterium]|nr:hypothetical protein [Solirubrobacteraceae bacterium]
MYHLEIRQFPKRVHRYNLSGEQLGAIVLAWVADRMVELGEQKWSPHTATITILEGPEVDTAQISMARGWRSAERAGRDVTDRVLAEAREAAAGGEGARVASAPVAAEAGHGASEALGDPLALGVELATLLGADPSRLLAAWRAVAARSSGLAPSESLALAERELARGEEQQPRR